MSELQSGVVLEACTTCGAAFFPPRLMCPRCGGRTWTPTLVHDGVVEELTTVRRSVGDEQRDHAVLATVRLPDAQRIVAALAEPLAAGASVRLHRCDSAVYAAPVDARLGPASF